MAFDVSTSFQLAALSTNVSSMIRTLTIVGSDLSSRVTEYAIISRESSEVVGDSVTFKLSNVEQQFNSYVNSKGLLITKIASLSFGYSFVGSSETVGLFSGQCTDLSFNESMEVDITFANKFSFLKKKVVGDEDDPISFISSNYNPADLAWYVVTSYAGLSGVQSTSNTDIDYTSFLEWQSFFNTESVTVRARFSGEDIIEILDSLRELTDSVIYIDQGNKIFFNKWIGLPSDSFSVTTSAVIEFSDFSVVGEDLLNSVVVQHGYDPDVNSWIGTGGNATVTEINSDSQSVYGINEKVYKDTLIWYPNSRSAYDLAKRIIFRRGQPNTVGKISIPLIFPQANVGDTIYVTYEPFGLSGVGFNLQGYEIDLNRGIMTINIDQGFGFGGGRAAGFVLDDSYYGLLDKDYNYLL